MAPGRKKRKVTVKTTTVADIKLKPPVTITQDGEDPLEIQSKNILSAVTSFRKDHQIELRKQIKELCYVGDGLYGRQDPLQLLPQEIWVMILKSLEITDLANCSRACAIFKTAINSSDQELLFAKALPILFPYLRGKYGPEIGIKRLVSCGRVCKQWRAGVDCFAKSFFGIKNPISNSVDKLVKEPVQNFEDKNMLFERSRYNVWNRTNDYDNEEDAFYFYHQYTVKYDRKFKIGDNPFLSHEELGLSEILHHPPLPTLKGNVIWHLDLKIGQVKPYTSKHVYSLCAKALQKCPNLKSLRLSECEGNSSNGKILHNGTIGEIIDPHLESLEVTCKTGDIFQVQNALLTDFSSQLKRVLVRHWNKDLYHTLEWNNLIELEILEGSCLELFKSLKQTTATKLYKLHIRLYSSCQDLSAFFKCINRFPNLRHLSVLVTDVFSGAIRQKILEVPLCYLTTNRIDTLEVFCRNLDGARDLPLLFPLLRNLVYRYGDRAKELKNFFTEFEGENASSADTKRIIQIYKNMNKSNIWRLLPHLNKLELDCKEVIIRKNTRYYKEDTVNVTRKFTRMGYIWETDKYKLGQELQLVKVREAANRQRKQPLRKRLEEERWQINRNLLKKPSKSIKLLRDQIFPFVLPKLGREDILSCRRVCKSWWKLVGEDILEGSKQNILYNFNVPSDAKPERSKFSAYVKNNKSRPFFARTVQLTLLQNNGNVEGIKFLLKAMGDRIHFLTLAAAENVVPDLADAYQICVECTKYCPNLRGFNFKIPVLGMTDKRAYKQLKKKLPLETPKHLEHLSTSGPARDNHAPLNKLVKDLEWAFHLQLRTLTQPDCKQSSASRLDRDTQFTKLREYTITNLDPKKASSDYYWEMRCKGLETLRLIINAPGMTIKTFKGIAKLWPNLKVLELQFGPKFDGLNKNIIYSDPKVIMPVSEVQVKLFDKYQVSLDFLIHFPYVKKLCITYGKIGSSDNESENKMLNLTKRSRNLLNEIPARCPELDFIQLMRYFKDDKNEQHDVPNIFASNIWNVLQKLKTVEVTYYEGGKRKDVQFFHRK